MANEPKTTQDETDEAAPQRGATRAPVQRPVRLQFDDSIDVVEAHCYNVSIGGMFVHSREGRPVGGLVRFELVLDDDTSIRGLAEVVWMRSQDHGPERVAGMGLKFRFLEQRDRQLIFKLVSQHIKERLAARHPGLGDESEDDPVEAPPPIRAAASTMERVPRAAAPTPVPVEALPSIENLDVPGSAAPAEVVAGQRRLLFEGSSEAQVDAFDGGSEPTGAWLQEGLGHPGGFEDSGFDAGADESGSFDQYDHESPSGELYDEEHFEHRPKPRRDIPILTLAAVLVSVLAIAVYLWGDRLFDSGTEDIAPAPLATGSDMTSDQAPQGVDGATSSAGTQPVPQQDASPPPPSAPSPAQAAIPPPPSQPPPSGPPPSGPAAAASSGKPFRIVREISARVAGPAVEIVITTDGSVDAGRLSHARLPDGAPRELIRLRGVGERFATEVIPVGIGAVRQVRTGWHRKSSGNEMHIVIDLGSASAQVTGLRVEGNRIIATVIG